MAISQVPPLAMKTEKQLSLINQPVCVMGCGIVMSFTDTDRSFAIDGTQYVAGKTEEFVVYCRTDLNPKCSQDNGGIFGLHGHATILSLPPVFLVWGIIAFAVGFIVYTAQDLVVHPSDAGKWGVSLFMLSVGLGLYTFANMWKNKRDRSWMVSLTHDHETCTAPVMRQYPISSKSVKSV